jgi:L-amino acid N-acyltransferase YncA
MTMGAQIRLAGDQDAETIAAIYRPYVETSAVSFEEIPPDRTEMARRIRETVGSYPWLVCDEDGQVKGYAYATRHRVRAAYQWSVETSVYVGGRHMRRGIGRGLYLSLFRILAAQGFFNAYAGIALPNPASVRLHESLGFEPIGVFKRIGHKRGAWHDVGWWQLALKALEAAPADPIDLAAVQRLPSWDSLIASGQSAIRATGV